ncbi:MAG TPA: nuclear transport factor 2 family protein [Puia sp.]|jgi:ketosteroid isomerase-like protein|nr:nuclear transport factor 2 family protein [Puia sp.]
MPDLQSLFDTYKTAIFQKDLPAFCSIFDDNVRIFDMWQQWSYEGLPTWRKMAEGWFSSLGADQDVVTFDDVQIQAAGELAVVTAIVRFAAVSAEGKELKHLEERLTWVAQKKAAVWKIIHQHTSGPIDFQSMKVILAR